jgi:hypothetical protein
MSILEKLASDTLSAVHERESLKVATVMAAVRKLETVAAARAKEGYDFVDLPTGVRWESGVKEEYIGMLTKRAVEAMTPQLAAAQQVGVSGDGWFFSISDSRDVHLHMLWRRAFSSSARKQKAVEINSSNNERACKRPRRDAPADTLLLARVGSSHDGAKNANDALGTAFNDSRNGAGAPAGPDTAVKVKREGS